MATVDVLGDGPIVFVDEHGLQVSVPLASIKFDSGSIVTQPSTPAGSPLDLWLKYLVSKGRLRPATTAPPLPAPAIIFTATAAGSQGNNIEVKAVANTTDPTKVDLTITASDHYVGLTAGTLTATLGSSTVPATRPGLLRVATVAATSVPVAGNLATVTAGLRAVDAAGAEAFVLAPRGPGADATGATLTATIANVQTTGSFDLDVTWTITVQSIAPGDMTQTALATKLAPFAFAVGFSAPISGGVPRYQFPAPGTARLTGGVDPAKASSALLSA